MKIRSDLVKMDMILEDCNRSPNENPVSFGAAICEKWQSIVGAFLVRSADENGSLFHATSFEKFWEQFLTNTNEGVFFIGPVQDWMNGASGQVEPFDDASLELWLLEEQLFLKTRAISPDDSRLSIFGITWRGIISGPRPIQG